MSRRTKVLLWSGGGVLLLIVAIVVVLGVLSLRQMGRSGEATARFVPESAIGYVSFNTRPGLSQLRLGRDVIKRLQTKEFLERRDDLLDEIEGETGIHFLDDVTPWLGTDVTFVLLDVGQDSAEWVLMAHVEDRDSATEFVEKLADGLEDDLYIEFSKERRVDVDMWLAEGEDLALGLTEDYLLAADGEGSMREMLDNMDSPPERSLADNSEFVAAQESLPSERVMFLFLRTGELMNLLEGMDDVFTDLVELNPLATNLPDYVAGSASFIDDGLRFDMVAETQSDGFALSGDDRLESPDVLPADTVAVFAMAGLDRLLEEALDEVRSVDEYSAYELYDFFQDLWDETEMDLERDIIDSLTGEIALALLPSGLGLFLPQAPSEVIEALLLVGVQNPAGIIDGLEKLVEYETGEGVEIQRDKWEGYEMVTIHEDGLSGQGYVPGYLVTDRWAVVGSNVDGIEAFQEASTGRRESLSSAPAFAELIARAPEPLHYLLYADIAAIVDTVEGSLDADMRSDYRRDVEPFVGQLQSYLLGASITAEEMRLSMFVTLRKESR